MDDVSPELSTASEGAHAAGESSPLEIAALQELDSLSLKEILDEDSRPTFVLDLDPDLVDESLAIQPVFCNAALKLHSRLLDSIVEASEECISRDPAAATYDGFRSWATGISRFNNSKDIFPLTILYQGLLWTGSTLRQRWRIISGNALYRASDIPKSGLSATLTLRPTIQKRESEAAKARHRK
jgi:hypothetical protein